MKRKMLAESTKSIRKKEDAPERLSETQKKSLPLKPGDFVLSALVLLLVVFGVIMVFSASYYYAISSEGTPYYYLLRDIPYAILGTVCMIAMAVVDYHKLRNLAIPVLLISIILLGLVFTPLGTELNNARRWLNLGVTIMPGEWAKAACILFVASWLSYPRNSIRNFKRGVLPPLVAVGIVAGLILAQPSTTTAFTIVLIALGIMFVAGINMIYAVVAGGVGIAGLVALILTDENGYRMKRIFGFLDPFADSQGTGYQVVQSLLALGSGGLTGVGLGKSMQKTLYLPEPQNDFILAIIGEELGFVGLLVLLAVYLILIWRCVHISMNAPDTFGLLLSSGITIMLGLQVILNVMIVTSLMPPTGISLPFISWGGNSLLVFMGCMGVMLNISRHSAK